jgi:hypothetical protein
MADQPEIKDFTNEMIEHLKAFVGHEVYQPLTVYKDETSDNLGFKVGKELRARGSARINEYQSHTGSIKRISVQNYNMWFADLKIVYRYTSQTTGETWGYPGGVLLDYPWGDLHPQGTIVATLQLQQSSGAVHLEVQVDADHDDNPGWFIRDRVVPQTIGKLDALMENFTGISIGQLKEFKKRK